MQFADFRHQREIHDVLQSSNPANKYLSRPGSLFDGVPPESKLQLIHPQTFVRGPSGTVVPVDFTLHQQAMVSASMLSPSTLLLPTSSSSAAVPRGGLPPLAHHHHHGRQQVDSRGELHRSNTTSNNNNSNDAHDDVATRLLLSRQSSATDVSVATVNEGIEVRDLKLEHTILTAKSRRYRRQLKSLLMTEITNSQQRLSLCRNGVSDPYGYQQELMRLREAPTPPPLSPKPGYPSSPPGSDGGRGRSPAKLGAAIQAHNIAEQQAACPPSSSWGEEVHAEGDDDDASDDDMDDTDAAAVGTPQPLLVKRKSFFFTDVPDWEASTPTNKSATTTTAGGAAGNAMLAGAGKKKRSPKNALEGSGWSPFATSQRRRGSLDGSSRRSVRGLGEEGGPQFCATPTNDDGLPPLHDLPPPSQLHRRVTQLPGRRSSRSPSLSAPLALIPCDGERRADDGDPSNTTSAFDHKGDGCGGGGQNRSPNRSPCSDVALLEDQQRQLEKQREDFFRFPDFQASVVLARDGATSPLLLGPDDDCNKGEGNGGPPTNTTGPGVQGASPAPRGGAGRKVAQLRGDTKRVELQQRHHAQKKGMSGQPSSSVLQASLSLVVDESQQQQPHHHHKLGLGSSNHRHHDQLVSSVRAMRLTPMPSGKRHMAIVSASHAVSDDVANDAIGMLQRRVGEQRKKYAKKYEAMDLQKSKLPFHATPSAVLQHVERLIVQQEKASSRKDAHQRIVDTLSTIETYCLNRFRNPTARQLVLDTHRLVVDEDVIPTREMFLTRLIHKVPPQLFLLDELTTVAVHLGEVYGLSRPLAVQVLRTYADAFVVDRANAVAQCLSDSDGDEWGDEL